MYRVFDNKTGKWVREGIYLSPNNDLSTSKKALFGTEKLSLASEHRYKYHRDIGLNDINGHLIFEGDICKIEHINVVGVIAYISEHASYYLLDEKNLKYYPLGEERCRQIEIVGNIFDNKDLLSSENNAKGEE